jgi:regulator of protease activity HflC (stomatin/prohibitin superfamily)
MAYVVLPLLAVALVVAVFLQLSIRRLTVLEYERGLRYVRGKFRSVLEPGQYWYAPFWTIIHKLDVRPRFVSITGQEVLSSDGVTIKVSLAANYEVTDPDVAVNKVQSFDEALYLELQLALREIVGTVDIDTVLSGRNELSRRLMEATEGKVAVLGLRLLSVKLKDVMFPGKLKEVFAQVVSAKKEGLAALEKARGETAALRHLANAARLLEDNPNLMQLRVVQAIGQAPGSTLVLGMPSQAVPVPVRTAQSRPPQSESATAPKPGEGEA